MTDIVERLLTDAEEIAGWGAGNEAATVRYAAGEITSLRSRISDLERERDEARDALKAIRRRTMSLRGEQALKELPKYVINATSAALRRTTPRNTEGGEKDG